MLSTQRLISTTANQSTAKSDGLPTDVESRRYGGVSFLLILCYKYINDNEVAAKRHTCHEPYNDWSYRVSDQSASVDETKLKPFVINKIPSRVYLWAKMAITLILALASLPPFAYLIDRAAIVSLSLGAITYLPVAMVIALGIHLFLNNLRLYERIYTTAQIGVITQLDTSTTVVTIAGYTEANIIKVNEVELPLPIWRTAEVGDIVDVREINKQ